jgi:hypothetical protein
MLASMAGACHQLLAAHRGRGFLQHLLQAAVADVVDLVQVVQVAHQHHAAVGAGQAGVAEAVAQFLEGGVVLEHFGRFQAAGAADEQRDHEGVDLELGAVVVAQAQGRGFFLDVLLQVAAALRIGVARLRWRRTAPRRAGGAARAGSAPAGPVRAGACARRPAGRPGRSR